MNTEVFIIVIPSKKERVINDVDIKHIVINWEITNQLNNELIQVILFLVNDNIVPIVLSSYF